MKQIKCENNTISHKKSEIIKTLFMTKKKMKLSI